MKHPCSSIFMRISECSRSTLVSVIVILFLLQPESANACDPNCDFVAFFVEGTPFALGTIVIAPLLGLAADQKPNSPYWQALGFTTLAVGVGWGIGMAKTSPQGEQVEDVSRLVALPVVMGVAATFLVYRFWTRPDHRTSGILWHNGPLVSVAPGTHGGFIRLSWHF